MIVQDETSTTVHAETLMIARAGSMMTGLNVHLREMGKGELSERLKIDQGAMTVLEEIGRLHPSRMALAPRLRERVEERSKTNLF